VLTQRQVKAHLQVGAINAVEVDRQMRGLDARPNPPGLAEAYAEVRAADRAAKLKKAKR
jgi:hypothetical protein